MPTMLPLDQMTREEKLRALEAPWADRNLRMGGGTQPPASRLKFPPSTFEQFHLHA